MASLLWTVLSALLLLHDSAAVTETELATITTQLLNAYRPTYRNQFGETPTFTLAVSIPFNPATRSYDINQVITADNGQTVRAAMDSCQVYQGNRVMAATVLKWPDVRNQCPNAVIPQAWAFVRALCPNVNTWADLSQACTNNINKKLAKSPNGAADHAEYRVLQNFNHLNNRRTTGLLNQNDLLVFYSLKSPCDGRCASSDNNWSITIATSTAPLRSINNWPNHVLVFSEIFVPGRTSVTENQLETNRRTALTNLGNIIGGLGNIYRCPVGSNRCSTCNTPTGVAANTCVSNTRSRSPSPSGN